ncbi:MAG: BPL-N domain-containing protein [bacterium]|nr:BPL-N domain-containing protein [bacterium]
MGITLGAREQGCHHKGYIVPLSSISDSSTEYQRQLDSFKAVSRLLRNRYTVFWLAESVQVQGTEVLPGSFIVPESSSPAFTELFSNICQQFKLNPIYTEFPRTVKVYTLRLPKVAIYCGDRTFDGPASFVRICEQLGVDCDMINGMDIRNGMLTRNRYNLVLIPGGLSTVQAYVIYPKGLTAIRNFVKRGNGYLGVCAGAYLAADTELGLNLVTNTLADSAAVGEVEIAPTNSDLPIFWGYPRSRFKLKYWCGPTFQLDSRVLAKIETVPAQWKKPELCQQGCMIASEYQKGKVVLIGPHPESSTGIENVEGMPRLYGNIIFYLTATQSTPSTRAIQPYFAWKYVSSNRISTYTKKSGKPTVSSAKLAELAERNLVTVNQIADLIRKVDRICERIDTQPEQGNLMWHKCYFVWRMPSAKEYIQKLQELLIAIVRMTTADTTDRNRKTQCVLPQGTEMYVQLQKMQRELPPVLASWRKIYAGMTEFEQEFHNVVMVAQKNQSTSTGNQLDTNTVISSDLKRAWWKLNIKEYIISAEFIGGESWKYWNNEHDMTESKLIRDQKTGTPVKVIHASTSKGALWTIVQLYLELHRILGNER